MFPDNTLFHVEMNAFNRITENETRVIIMTIVVWIGQIIVTRFGGFPRVNAQWVVLFIQPFE